MNTTARRTVRSLFIAVPLATLALALTPGTAMAETPAPDDNPGIVIIQPNGPDPKPFDIAVPTPAPKPQPDGPKTLSDGENEPTVHPKPAPAPQPKPQPQPSASSDVADTLDQGCFEGCDLPELPELPEATATPAPAEIVDGSGISPDRIDAAAPTTEETAVAQDGDSLGLTGPLAGLGALLALIAALVVRRRQQRA